MNLRFSNLCNYGCRSCDPKYSSVWAQEQGWSKPVINVIDDSPDYLEQILEHLPYVEYINFTGGESLLTPEHWIILERLIEIGKTDINIDFYTNVSRLEYKDRSIIDVVKNFNLDKFKVRVSLDATHERAELYRNGTVWSTVERNLRLLRQNDINVVVNSTIGAMNVWHAPDLQRYLLEQRLILNQATDSIINPWVLTNLVYPSHMRTTVLPNDYKLQVKEKILAHIEYLKQNNHRHDMWNLVIDYMMSRDDSELLPTFIEFNKNLDAIRNQKTIEIFPELKNIENWNQ
jgi:sulfatase maturation enzyme AslB (radical SAM superfamily)